MSERAYAAQCWAPGVLDGTGLWPGTALQIIGRDLAFDAQAHGITDDNPIELWAKEDGTKGFFAGDTSGLPGEGWTKLAEL